MMILRSSPPSPFGRKVKIAAKVLSLMDRIEVVNADTVDPSDALRRQNPLGKIPTLLLDDGTALYDSRVILNWLDDLAGGGRIIPRGPERFKALVMEALADGIMDAAILIIYESRWREEGRRDEAWVAHQRGKIERALAHAESALPPVSAVPDVGAIALGCALGYLDLRHGGTWRAAHPQLVDWLAAFEQAVPAFGETAFKG